MIALKLAKDRTLSDAEFATYLNALDRDSGQDSRSPDARRRDPGSGTSLSVMHRTSCISEGDINFPVALEGALKLKEISYIHAEGYPAAEMKHGPIALIDRFMPVVFLAMKDSTYSKVLANIEEVAARQGSAIAITDNGMEIERLVRVRHQDSKDGRVLDSIYSQSFRCNSCHTISL